MSSDVPTIKGMFVLSHLAAVERLKGKGGLKELERRFGRPLNFGNFEDVSILDEVRLIEHALDIIQNDSVPASERIYEAGRFHFENFTTTPLGKIIFSVFGRDFKRMFGNAASLSGHIFNGLRIEVRELSPTSLELTMDKDVYPVDHFRGLIMAWMDFSGLKGSVKSSRNSSLNRDLYFVEWKEL